MDNRDTQMEADGPTGRRRVATSTMTVLEAISSALQRARLYNRSVLIPPAAVLWPDEGRQWEPVLPLLRTLDPTLVTLGDYALEC